jgi:hypothetical protein
MLELTVSDVGAMNASNKSAPTAGAEPEASMPSIKIAKTEQQRLMFVPPNAACNADLPTNQTLGCLSTIRNKSAQAHKIIA